MGDSASFQSVLESVKRMRESAGAGLEAGTAPVAAPPAPPPTAPTAAPTAAATPPPRFQPASRVAKHQHARRPPPRAAPPTIIVSKSQRGNLLLNHLDAYRFEAPLTPDYIVGSASVWFISLRYYSLHPEYLHERYRKAGLSPGIPSTPPTAPSILLVLVDVDDPTPLLKTLSPDAARHGVTTVLAWSAREAADYLSLLRTSRSSQTSRLLRDPMAASTASYSTRLDTTLTRIPTVSKTNAFALRARYRLLYNLAADPALPGHLLVMPGIGERRRAALLHALNGDFRPSPSSP